ncbi:MAG: bacterioferritin [Gammaproteobacteria bacterium]|nr:bacterioferritin [Gammaproteobacteria bacterium]
MQGEVHVIEGLNLCLRDQLMAINQLFLHARMAGNWGLKRLNDAEYRRSIDAMKMADVLIERILFLEGRPAMQFMDRLMIGDDVPGMLQGDLDLLSMLHGNLVDTLKSCEDARDFISRDQLEDLLEETEEHIDWVETQQHLIAAVGLENYLQAQMED